MNTEQEEAFWGYVHTDDLFRNFGFVPSPHDQNHKKDTTSDSVASVAQTPAETTTTTSTTSSGTDEKKPEVTAPTLESFLAAFANEPHSLSNQYLMSLPLPYTATSSVAGTPGPNGVNTSDIMPGYAESVADSEGRVSGAKKLKQIGAGQAEIEEDKRRRNTEASARFRAKKKEREQAVERRAKDLEAQVAQLTADKASLENENRLLKAIVLNGTGGQAEALQDALVAFGKRKRE